MTDRKEQLRVYHGTVITEAGQRFEDNFTMEAASPDEARRQMLRFAQHNYGRRATIELREDQEP